MLKKLLTFIALPVLSVALTASTHADRKVHFTNFVSTNVKEPSDLVIDPETGNLFVVSDNGKLYECTPQGQKIRKADFEGVDFEAIELKDGKLYVSDETTRKIYAFDKKTLQNTDSWYIQYGGGRNKGFETIVWNQTKKVFVLVTERDPVSIWELDTNFRVIRQFGFKAAKDISGGRYYKGDFWLLSDESMALFRCNPNNYEVKENVVIDILNPEGVDFDAQGNAIVSADDLQRLYFFNGLANPTN